MTPQATIIASTEFRRVPPEVSWGPSDSAGGSAVAEFGGRGCYGSWNRPNPATEANPDYLAHVIEVGHYSVLEHATVTFYVSGISRALSHELVRHRHLSPSQLSQRYAAADDGLVLPPLLRDLAETDPAVTELVADVEHHHGRTLALYDRVADTLTSLGYQRKEARQAARAVLPNATPTAMTLTGNWRAWRHFVDLRATLWADEEIAELAMIVLTELRADPTAYPGFADYFISEQTTDSGRARMVASSPYAERS